MTPAPRTAPARRAPRRAPVKTPETDTIYQAGGTDPNICHLLDEYGKPLCGAGQGAWGLPRDNHLIVGDKAKDTPCPVCGRTRCEKCGIATAS